MAVGQSSITRIYFHTGTFVISVGVPPFLLMLGRAMGVMIAGTVKDLIAPVHVQSNGMQFIATTLAVIRLEQDGDADDGKYWDGDSWEVALAAPAAAHFEAGLHLYQLPAAATTGRTGARIHFTFTDDQDESLATTVSAGGEMQVESVTHEEIKDAIDEIAGTGIRGHAVDPSVAP